MRRATVLAWLYAHAAQPVLFSDITRDLVTNRPAQRARSRIARAELRSVLARLGAEGVVALYPSERKSDGLVIELLPKDASTQGEADE